MPTIVNMSIMIFNRNLIRLVHLVLLVRLVLLVHLGLLVLLVRHDRLELLMAIG